MLAHKLPLTQPAGRKSPQACTSKFKPEAIGVLHSSQDSTCRVDNASWRGQNEFIKGVRILLITSQKPDVAASGFCLSWPLQVVSFI